MRTIVALQKEINERRFEVKKKIGENLKHFRTESGLTQDEIGEMLGIERTTVTNIEKTNQNMTLEHLLGFCEAFNVTPNDLLKGIYAELNEVGSDE